MLQVTVSEVNFCVLLWCLFICFCEHVEGHNLSAMCVYSWVHNAISHASGFNEYSAQVLMDPKHEQMNHAACMLKVVFADLSQERDISFQWRYHLDFAEKLDVTTVGNCALLSAQASTGWMQRPCIPT